MSESQAEGNQPQAEGDELAMYAKIADYVKRRASGEFPFKTELREQIQPIFLTLTQKTQDDIKNDSARADLALCKQFFDQAGQEQFFGVPLGKHMKEILLERFDFDDKKALNYMQLFRAFKHVLLSIYAKSDHGTDDAVPQVEDLSSKGYTELRFVSKGAQGSAWRAINREGQVVAVKKYDRTNSNAPNVEELIDELKTLIRTKNCPNIMDVFEIFQDRSYMYCVYEFLPGGDLSALRKNARKVGVDLTEEYFRPLFKQCLMGLEQLHKRAILHCDIKEHNIMIKNTCYQRPQIVLIDVGLSVDMVGKGESGGTPGYRPPETCLDSVWLPKGDVFSMGVTFFQLMADMVPDGSRGILGVFQEGARSIDDTTKFVTERPLPIHKISGAYPGVEEWLMSMVAKNRHERPVPATLLDKYDWFKVEHNTDKCPPYIPDPSCFAGCSLM
jgi:serine/threonine protein kinase